jgi:hypothetical protein
MAVKEVETQVLIAERLHYVDSVRSDELVKSTTEVARLISGLLNSLNKKIPQWLPSPLSSLPSPLFR